MWSEPFGLDSRTMANWAGTGMRLSGFDYLIESFLPPPFNPSGGEAESVKGAGSEDDAWCSALASTPGAGRAVHAEAEFHLSSNCTAADSRALSAGDGCYKLRR